jgi:hypothetical protein
VVSQIEKLKADLVAAQTTAEVSRNQAQAAETEVVIFIHCTSMATFLQNFCYCNFSSKPTK